MPRKVGRIEISGGIASGKTTLAKLLQNAGFFAVYENFRKNPFYQAFYRDPVGTAFETEITFLLQHYHQQKMAAAQGTSFCCDFSLVLDQAYAFVTLDAKSLNLFQAVHSRTESQLPRRSLLIYLACRSDIELKRIRARRRRAERVITVDYLGRINRSLHTRITSLPHTENVLTIDSGHINFADSRSAQTTILENIEKQLQLARK
jgi:deoxyadenosine/deoxycytidine kinase